MGGKDGYNGVLETIYKLKCVIFCAQKTQGKNCKHTEITGKTQGIALNLSVATLKYSKFETWPRFLFNNGTMGGSVFFREEYSI